MEPTQEPLSADNLLTAARRVMRFIRIDDQAHGGLLSQETIQANEHMSKHIEIEIRRIKDSTNAISIPTP